MFCTYPDGRIPIPPIFDDKEEHWWSYVKLPLFVPYFQLVCGSTLDKSDGCVQTLFLHAIDQVIGVYDDVEIDVDTVQVVSPGYMNGTGAWKIDSLESVYRGVESRSNDFIQYAHVYVVAGGVRYLHSSVASDETDLTDVELLCDLSAHHSSDPPQQNE